MQGMSFEYSEDGEEFEEVFVPCVDGVIQLKAGTYRNASEVPVGVVISGARSIGSLVKSMTAISPFAAMNLKQRTGKGERKRNRKDRWK
jgi:hypothetical protein